MGTWGAGNFDSDAALDYLSFVVERWMTIIDRAFAGTAPEEAAPLELAPGLDMIEGCIMPTVELIIMTILHNDDTENFPYPEKVAEWSRLALAIYDDEIDGFDPDEEYKTERRQMIADTFDRLLTIANQLKTDLEGPEPEWDNPGL